MKITLEETELHTAIVSYIKHMGFSVDNKELTIDFTAGRGPNGTSSATIEVGELSTVNTTDATDTNDTTDVDIPPNAPVFEEDAPKPTEIQEDLFA